MPTPTTLGPNTGDAVAYTGHTLATASCQVDFGMYTSLLNVAMHDSVEVEAVLKITTDLKSLATVFAHGDASTYYKFVHRDEKFDTDFGDDVEALKTHNETLSLAYTKLDLWGTHMVTGLQRFSRRIRGHEGDLQASDRFPNRIIHYIMARMFSPDQPPGSQSDLPKAYLRTDIFSTDKVQSEILNEAKMDMLMGCAVRNWLDPSKIDEDSDFIATHRSSQDNAILGYSVNVDGIKDADILVLNITFKPDQIVGFESVPRTLRVEFTHSNGHIDNQLGDVHEWKFANQEVFTATGVASDEVVGLGTNGEGVAN